MINISIYYLVHLFIRYSSSNEKTRSFQSQVFKFQSSISTKVSFQYYYQFDLWRWRPIDFVTLYVFIPLTQTSNIQISVTSSIAITSISCSYNTKFLSIRLIKHVNNNMQTIFLRYTHNVYNLSQILSQHHSHMIFLSIRSAKHLNDTHHDAQRFSYNVATSMFEITIYNGLLT